MTGQYFSPRLALPVKFFLFLLLILAFSLGIFYFLLRPPLNDLRLMALFLALTTLFSGIVGYVAYRLGWVQRSPTIRWTLLGGYALSSFLTFINVWVTARLMFASEHDLLMATVLLFFAGTIAMALGYIISTVLTERIHQLDIAAQTISQGDLDVLIPTEGRDEMAGLAQTFNIMAQRLKEADRQQRELEDLRRDLIAWVSHDLQTPLASIRAILEALADGMVEEPATVNRYLETAHMNIRSLSTLIDDLIQMSQLDTGRFPLDKADNSITDLISDTIESFSELASRKGVSLHASVEPGVDPVFMDAQRIGRVLNNLMSNALQHAPLDGRVEMDVVRAGEFIQVEISNPGVTIHQQDLPYIFDRFYRGEKSRSRATGGSGLGLAIARGIVEAHGGRIKVESQQDLTRFTFTIPRQ